MELDVVLIGRESSSYQHFPLIEACPSLEKLDVKVIYNFFYLHIFRYFNYIELKI